MVGSPRVEQLLLSKRWQDFLATTATGLQLNLQMLSPGAESPPVDTDGLAELDPTGDGPGIAIQLGSNLIAIARDLAVGEAGRAPLRGRAVIARNLLLSFQAALLEGHEGGRRAIELSALRQMNHIVLALFQGDDHALQRSFDLILSALIILLDATGSWLEISADPAPALFIKGNAEAVAQYRRDGVGDALIVPVNNGSIHGVLGVIAPGDHDPAQALLPLMAQECAIAIEVSQLFLLVRQQLTRVLGAMSSAIVLFDRRGMISYLNPAAERLLGTSFVSTLGRPAGSLAGPWSVALQHGGSRPASGFMDAFSDGEERRWLDWAVYPLSDAGAVAGYVLMADDRTDYYQWQEAVRRAERMSATTTIIGSLAHELRNPLSSVKGLLQLMTRKQDPEHARAYADLIEREVDRVVRLLNEFLLLGRPAVPAPEPLDLAELLTGLRPLLEGEAYGTGTDLALELMPVPPVIADPGQLTQVLLNLVRNAVQACPDNGRVAVRLRSLGDQVALAVEDNGHGIDEHVRAHLFEPFFTTKERGTGLGLPVVQAIVHNHGGSVAATNGPNGGAVLTVTLPALRGGSDESLTIDVVTIGGGMYMAEQIMKAANVSVINLPALDERAGRRFAPGVVLLDVASVPLGALIAVRKTWPGASVMVLGESDDCLPGIARIPRPCDPARVVSLVRLELRRSEDRAKEA